MAVMLLSLLSVLLVFGLCLLISMPRRQEPTYRPPNYSDPPHDWPDVAVSSLRLFDENSRINEGVVAKTPVARRFVSYAETQDFVVDLMERAPGPLPKVALRLSSDEGPAWTDVMLDGSVVAHVQTNALASMRHANSWQ